MEINAASKLTAVVDATSNDRGDWQIDSSPGSTENTDSYDVDESELEVTYIPYLSGSHQS